MPTDLSIEQIRPQLTWRLRHEVLYPNEPLQAMRMDEDDHGSHFGAFINNELVGIVSIFQRNNDIQFRKFAVRADMQGKKIGNRLLAHITTYAGHNNCSRIWCNARLSAIGFYAKNGFTSTGDTFSKNGVDYEILEKIL